MGRFPLLARKPITSCSDCTLGQAAGDKRCTFAPVTLQSGSILCAQGERSRAVYFVKAGLVSPNEAYMKATDKSRFESLLAGASKRGEH